MSLILDGTTGITFPAGGITLPGSTSGTCNITATAISGTAVLTMPTGTDTLVGKATTDTLTNKTLVAPALGTPISGTLTNCTGLPVAGGGTGLATLTANNVILGAGTSSPTFVAPSTSGNYLTSNGTTWVSSTPAASGITTGKAIAMSLIFGL